MATKIAVALEDDLDGGPAEETVRFGVGGAEYEIDLSNSNAKTFRPGSGRLSSRAPGPAEGRGGGRPGRTPARERSSLPGRRHLPGCS